MFREHIYKLKFIIKVAIKYQNTPGDLPTGFCQLQSFPHVSAAATAAAGAKSLQ